MCGPPAGRFCIPTRWPVLPRCTRVHVRGHPTTPSGDCWNAHGALLRQMPDARCRHPVSVLCVCHGRKGRASELGLGTCAVHNLGTFVRVQKPTSLDFGFWGWLVVLRNLHLGTRWPLLRGGCRINHARRIYLASGKRSKDVCHSVTASRRRMPDAG